MPNVSGIQGFNSANGATNKLLAGFGNDIVDVTLGTGFSLNLTSGNDVEFRAWLDRLFFQNNAETPKTFNGTVWSKEYVGRTLISKYLYPLKSRMYLANCKFASPQAPNDANGNAITFPSRVFFSDLFQGNTLTWGIEWGQNGATYASNNIFEVTTTGGYPVQDFKATNIKVGDPLFITNGNSQLVSAKPYIVSSVDSSYRLRVTENFPVGATSLHFWVGSNWFDVATDDGDTINWLDENDDKLLIFKRLSLWRYNQVSLQKVKAAPGTTYGRSVVNIGDLTIYFHGSNINTRKTGIYVYNGGASSLVSRAIQPYINAIAAASYGSVVSWREGVRYRAYVGTISDSQRNISMTQAVITWDTEGGQFSIDTIADVITARGTWIQSSTEKYFIGTSDSQALESPSGNSHNTSDISFAIETGVKYPSTSNVDNKFTRVKVESRDAKGTQVLYKLYGPKDDGDTWIPLGEIQHNHQEFIVPPAHQEALGINIRFQERSTKTNTLVIQKIVIFYIPITTQVIGE